MKSPPEDDQAAHHAYWLRKVINAREEIAACLAKAGFEVPENDAIILVTVARRVSLQVAVGLMSDLGIAERAIGEAFDRLVRQAYLEFRNEPGAPRRTMLELTKQGYAAYRVILDAVNSRHWADLPFRQGDIVISSVPKSGTTWVQMICALLIFQTTDLPAPLPELSPDPDNRWYLRDAVLARLAVQRHRRFIKTHADLGKVPANPLVTYIAVARHPLDTELSLSYQTLHQKRPIGQPPLAEQASPREALLHWIDPGNAPAHVRESFTLPAVLEHLSAAWARRCEPNVALVHYEDLSADLEGQMRLLAVRLGISVPEALWPRLVAAATFEQMRAAADRLQPLPELADHPKSFFRSGRSGAGRELLTGAELARYYDLAARLAPADLLDWLHRERGHEH